MVLGCILSPEGPTYRLVMGCLSRDDKAHLEPSEDTVKFLSSNTNNIKKKERIFVPVDCFLFPSFLF